MDTATGNEFIKVYNQIKRLQSDIADVAKDLYSQSIVQYDEINGTPQNLSDFNNDTHFITIDDVDQKISKIELPDCSDNLKCSGDDLQICNVPTTFKELRAKTQKASDSSDLVATTEFVHNLVKETKDSAINELAIGVKSNDFVTKKEVYNIVNQELSDYDTSIVVDEKIQTAISGINVPTKLSQLQNDCGYITIEDIPGDLVTSVNGQVGDVVINIPVVPTNISAFTNDVGYITDPGVTSVNNQTGNVYVQENVQSNWNSTSGLSVILNKPSLKQVATTGDYEDLENKPDIPANKIFYGTCATAAATAAKVVECEEFTSSDLVAGTILLVRFSATNSGAVASLTLNVNSTGANKIQYINNGTRGNLGSAGYLKASTTYAFVFDGTYWLFLHNYNSNTTYSAMTQAEATAGTATTARTITAAVLKQAVKTHAQVHDVTVDGVSVLNGTTAEITMPTIPTNLSEFTNDANFATMSDVQTEVSNLVDQAPQTLDTLGKLSTALGDDPDFATTVGTQIGQKQDTIADLETIRSGAALGSTALQSFTETDPTVPTWAKQSSKPTYTAAEVGALPDDTALFSGDYEDLTNKPTIPPTMTILSYGNSTWNDFMAAYNTNTIVYCRASSNSNPATGSQTRMAFLAYVNNATNPTEVEFQYYRSVSTHSDSQQGDQVYVYKLNKSTGWSVTLRQSFTKIVAGQNMTSTWSNGVLTLNAVSPVTDSDWNSLVARVQQLEQLLTDAGMMQQ